MNDPFSADWKLDLGANPDRQGGTSFKVWAPYCKDLAVKILDDQTPRLYPMKPEENGYFETRVNAITPGTCYFYVLDGAKERPDPASRFQSDGVHRPSCVVDSSDYSWSDRNWCGAELAGMIFYELHIGTFTAEGTFAAAVRKLPYLKKLGITCVEIMPVAQFPGTRNWGYDGVFPYAVQASYGGPFEFKKFINACHAQGLAVCLDVVYNHLGPEGNYLHDYGPYFTDRYRTPWGQAWNYDGARSDPVRHYIISNALFWITEYHVDALRLDAIHGIYDFSARHILDELTQAVKTHARLLGREALVIAESDLNDSRIIRPRRQGGCALDAQWSDDFHHAVHTLVTGEKTGYYEDFGRLEDLADAYRHAFVYDGRYSVFRRRRHGNPARDLPLKAFCVAVQNHDQVGNRAFGERLSALASFESRKLAAAALIFSPYLPLLFMGEEYDERSPFQYFVDHGDPQLIEAVRRGRKEEFASFGWTQIPDPESETTFLDSKLRWTTLAEPGGRCMLRLYRDLITLRKKMGLHRLTRRNEMKVSHDRQEKTIALLYRPRTARRAFGMLLYFGTDPACIRWPFASKRLAQVLNTHWRKYGGSLADRDRSIRAGKIPLSGTGAVVLVCT